MIPFLTGTLFVTTLWIIIYTTTVDYLNFLFPPKVAETTYGGLPANPEPFEISLYIILTGLFIILLWFFYARNVKGLKMPSRTNFVLFIFLLFLFVKKLGNFPFANDIHPFIPLPDKTIYAVIFVSYLLIVVFLILEISLLQRILEKKRFYPTAIFLLIAVVIGIFVLDLRFPISPLDIAHYYGASYEVATGKTIFSQVPSQYGFLSVLLFGLIYKLTHIKFIYLPVIILLLTLAIYFISFHLIYRTSRSMPFSLLGIFSMLTIHYYSGTYGPQASPLRWLPLFLFLLLFTKFKRIDARGLIAFIPFLSFWSIDAGVALLFAYLATFSLLFLVKKIGIKNFISSLILLSLSIFLFIGAIQIIHLILGLHLVDLFKLYQGIRKNAVVGLLMVPIDKRNYFWFFMLVYFASIIYFFKSTNKSEARNPKSETNLNYQNKNVLNSFNNLNLKDSNIVSSFDIRISNLTLLLFSANLMFFASIYYVGRSMPYELYTISAFALLTFFLLVGVIYRSIKSKKIRILSLFLLFIFFIALPGWVRKDYISAKIMNKYLSHPMLDSRTFAFDLEKTVENTYKKEVALITTHISEASIAILSADDTYLFYLTQKKNLLDANPLIVGVEVGSEMEPTIKNISKVCPQKIVADCSLMKRCSAYKTLSTNRPQTLQAVLAEIEKKCKITYTPQLCTDKLCIAHAQ